MLEQKRRASTVEARAVSRSFGAHEVLSEVSLAVRAGEIHALLGPNGAGKTTLLRILCGLVTPTSGAVRVDGLDPYRDARAVRARVGLVPAGDRTFYLRLSGLENLVFFARLHGLPRKRAARRAQALLERVGLEEAVRRPVGRYSHGMQKRLSVARALLARPRVLLVDEATHDLDPASARNVRELVAELARDGAAVVWTTQRIEEIRGFVDEVTVLHRGATRFVGTVAQLTAATLPRRYVVRLENGASRDPGRGPYRVAGGGASLLPLASGERDHQLLLLSGEAVIGDALAELTAAGVRVLSCREERSEIEEAFLSLTEADA